MLPIALHFLNETLVGQTQANPYCLKFPKLEIVLCKNNFAWHFSNCYYSFLKLGPGTLPHLKEVFWDKSERFLVFFYLLLSQRDLSSMWQGSRIHLWTVSLCCSFLFSWKDIVMFSEVALVSVSCNCLISWIVIVQGYRLQNAANTANTANAIPLSHFLQKYTWNNWPLSYWCFFKKS